MTSSNKEGHQRDGVLDSLYVAVCHSEETHFLKSEKVESSKTLLGTSTEVIPKKVQVLCSTSDG